MPALFDFLKSINSNDAIDLDVENPYGAYVPFQINNGLAQHMDTILFANEMNKYPELSKEMQYKFLLHAVPKKKRYGAWAKVEEVANKEDIETVSKFYEVNLQKAAEYLPMIGPEELEYMRKKNDPGGCDAPKVKTIPKTKKAKK